MAAHHPVPAVALREIGRSAPSRPSCGTRLNEIAQLPDQAKSTAHALQLRETPARGSAPAWRGCPRGRCRHRPCRRRRAAARRRRAGSSRARSARPRRRRRVGSSPAPRRAERRRGDDLRRERHHPVLERRHQAPEIGVSRQNQRLRPHRAPRPCAPPAAPPRPRSPPPGSPRGSCRPGPPIAAACPSARFNGCRCPPVRSSIPPT